MLVRALRVIGATLFWSIVVSILWVLLLRVAPPPVTWVMADQAGEQDGVERSWRPLGEMARSMPLAVIAAEDQKFFDHFGFDIEAMREAMKYNDRKKGRRIKGASTLSQQTAKNVFCWAGRSYLRKGVEAWFTLLIECLWSKERILEVYLNVAETGKGRFGVEATAKACFKRPAATITASQAALIAAVLPSPRRFQACRPSGYMQRRQGWILGQMGQLGDLLDPVFRARIEAEQETKDERRARRRGK